MNILFGILNMILPRSGKRDLFVQRTERANVMEEGGEGKVFS